MVNLRLTAKEDLRDLARIYIDAYNPLNIGEYWNDKSALKLLEHFIEKQPELFFTAEEKDKIIGGIVAFVKPWWDGNHLTDGEIFVEPTYQGRGVGKLLIKHMFEVAKEKYNAVSWDTFTHIVHEQPLKWYKRMGFEEIKQWTMITGNINEVLKKLSDI